ncbi:MAG: hypothetical protein RR475_02530 [Clostridia bacterium]
MKRLLSLTLAIIMLLPAFACSTTDVRVISEGSVSEPGASDKTGKRTPIKIEQLDWAVEETVIDGDRALSLNYTNNSKYTIASFCIKFEPKENATDEELSLLSDVKDLSIDEIFILGENYRFASPGETVYDSMPCQFNQVYELVQSVEQYNIMEPTIATIEYLDGDMVYTEYYDFKTTAYGESSHGGEYMHEWSESEISKLIPRIEDLPVYVSNDNEDRFDFYAYGASREYLEAYIEKCKESGFTTYDLDAGDWIILSNGQYKIDIGYHTGQERLRVSVSKN